MLIIESLANDVAKAWGTNNLGAAVNALAVHLVQLAQDRAAYADAIEDARKAYAQNSDDDIEIDDDPLISDGDDGTWVSAWVWVPHG